jgi:methylenetetrahydrofolate/methylenetetrahydromethanopterin dehydrogenase (NADP+)
MGLPRVLIQLDTDSHASVFDAMVAIDSGVDHLLQYSAVDEESVVSLVHGAMFTRSPAELSSTALFIGGSSTESGEALCSRVQSAFFGPIRVSVMLDSNGSNTTAAAAVLCAARHLDLAQAQAVILGGTGPVGGRAARLLVSQGATVHLVSREHYRASRTCQRILEQLSGADPARQADPPSTGRLEPVGMRDAQALTEVLATATLVISCGAAGIQLLDEELLAEASNLQVAIDLNAVPPGGIHGINPTDKAVERQSRIDYGAIGVGGLKMKIHRAAIQALFDRNDRVLDVDEIFAIGGQLEASRKTEGPSL